MSSPPLGAFSIEPVTAADLGELLGLMRAYCDFYGAAASDRDLLELSRSLLADPEREGVQLIARDRRSTPAGFATIFWSWDTTEASRIGIMNDLYVVAHARARGLADQLIRACVQRCAQRGVSRLEWQTGPENLRAQAVYARAGATREPWLIYTLPTPRA